MQGSPRNLLGFKGAVGGSLFTAISHGRIGDVVQTSHALGKEIVQWRHLYVASDCLNPAKKKNTNNKNANCHVNNHDYAAVLIAVSIN